jgi:hypothetical protein
MWHKQGLGLIPALKKKIDLEEGKLINKRQRINQVQGERSGGLTGVSRGQDKNGDQKIKSELMEVWGQTI